MAYTPVPTDITQPVDSVLASTAAAEFRALKQYIQTIVSGGGPGAQTPGMIADFAFATAPPGWLVADGSLVSRALYPALWALVQSNGAIVPDANWSSSNYGCYSTGDGSTTFRLPDFRSMVRKGGDGGRGFGSQAVGKYQGPLSEHKHAMPLGYDSGGSGYTWHDGGGSPVFGSTTVGPAARGLFPVTGITGAVLRIAFTDFSGTYGASPVVSDWNIVPNNGVLTCIKT